MLLAIVLVQAAAVANLQGDHKVEVDGQKYRVHVRGNTVSAFNKSIVLKRTPERGEGMRKAVIAATGCKMKDEYWSGSHLTGSLECSDRVTRPTQ